MAEEWKKIQLPIEEIGNEKIPDKIHYLVKQFMRLVVIDNHQSDCWGWRGCINNKGYSILHYHNRKQMAHRISYQIFHGKILDDLDIDHLCRNPVCSNPDHLEPVTHQENTLRGDRSLSRSYCKNGHALKGKNLIISSGNKAKLCRICERARTRIKRAKNV